MAGYARSVLALVVAAVAATAVLADEDEFAPIR